MSDPIISGFGRRIWLGHVTCKWGGGRRRPHIWNSRTRFAYSLYNFHGGTMKIKGSLLMSDPIVSGFGGKIWLGHVTCKRGGGLAADPIFGIPEPDLPIHCTTLMGLR